MKFFKILHLDFSGWISAKSLAVCQEKHFQGKAKYQKKSVNVEKKPFRPNQK